MYNKNDIKEKIIKFVGDLKIDTFSDFNSLRLYSYFFGEVGYSYDFVGNPKDGFKVVSVLAKNQESLTADKNQIIGANGTINELLAKFDGMRFSMSDHIVYIVADNLIMEVSVHSGNVTQLNIATERNDLDVLRDEIQHCLFLDKHENEKDSYKVAFRGQYSIETTSCKFDEWNSDIKANYNDDLPYDEMNRIIRRDKAGLIMFYGIPGTGKTSLVKSLINDNKETNFVFIDTSVCESISDGMFLEFLQNYKNSVIVFEDCEKLLKSRDDGGNESISTILNLTDGIIAETMKIKFICTFNCPLSKVDKALMRKGRLSLKYEFKELSLDKTKAIYPEATKPMTLADVHNATEKNDYSEEKVRKIGF